MKIRVQLFWLLFVLTLIFLSVLLIQRNYEKNRLISLFRSVQAERESAFNKILDLKRSAPYTFAFDYSYWDDMVKFVTKPDVNWAHENLDSGLATYKSNAVWVYDADFQVVYSINNLGDPAGFKEIPVPHSALLSAFANKALCHFFVNTPKGLMEFFGAYIQPSADIERKTPALGYFFCGRLWDKSYVDGLAEVTDSTLTLADTLENHPVAFGKNSFGYSRVLAGWDNKPVKYLIVSVLSQAIEDAKRTTAQVSTLFISFLVVTLAMLYFFITHWISNPLKAISLSLEKGDSSFLKTIESHRNEFGAISRLIGSFFTQRQEVMADIVARQKIEDQLSQSLEEERKSREIVTSMLEDNNQIREELEERIEELKRAQNMLVHSEKLASLGRIVSEVAHEVNNPLMIISGNAQLFLMSGTMSAEEKQSLQNIIEECQRAKGIIQRLLRFSRPSKGDAKETDINTSIETIMIMLENQFKLENIEVRRKYQERLPRVSIDEQQMQEVFMNLMNNAKEAMPCGGSITISTSLAGEFVRIDFADTGAGMSDEVKHKLFEPFFTTKEKGTGLGLSVCYGIIKAHHGELKFESELGKGTVVTILLPVGAA